MCSSFVPGLDKTRMAIRPLDLGSNGVKDSMRWDCTAWFYIAWFKNTKNATGRYWLCTADSGNEAVLYEWHLQKNKTGCWSPRWKSGSFSKFSLLLRSWTSEGPVHGLWYSPYSGHWKWSLFVDITLIGNEMVKYLSTMKFSQILTFCFSNWTSGFYRIRLLAGVIWGFSSLEPWCHRYRWKLFSKCQAGISL